MGDVDSRALYAAYHGNYKIPSLPISWRNADHVLYLSHSLSTVTMLLHSLIAVLLKLLLLLLTRSPASAGTTTVVGNSCGTDQNPYCAGNSVLEQLCCPYPNVCYWQNRNGDPGCCPAGQWCDGSYPYYSPTHNPTTIWVTTPTSTCTTTTPNVITTTTWNSCQQCVTVTSGVVPVTTVTQGQPQTTANGVIIVNSTAISVAVSVWTPLIGVLLAVMCNVAG